MCVFKLCNQVFVIMQNFIYSSLHMITCQLSHFPLYSLFLFSISMTVFILFRDNAYDFFSSWEEKKTEFRKVSVIKRTLLKKKKKWCMHGDELLSSSEEEFNHLTDYGHALQCFHYAPFASLSLLLSLCFLICFFFSLYFFSFCFSPMMPKFFIIICLNSINFENIIWPVNVFQVSFENSHTQSHIEVLLYINK